MALFSRADKRYGVTRRRCGFAIVILLLTVLVLSWQSSASWAQSDFLMACPERSMPRTCNEACPPAIRYDFACPTSAQKCDIYAICDEAAASV